jgi:hypothetical protein
MRSAGTNYRTKDETVASDLLLGRGDDVHFVDVARSPCAEFAADHFDVVSPGDIFLVSRF